MDALPRDLRWLSSLPILLILIALTALLARADHAYAATFNPSGDMCLAPGATTLADLATVQPGVLAPCGGDSSPGAAATITSTFKLPKGDSKFGATVNFIPPEWNVPADVDITDAAIVGQLFS
jgi:hypothetical protein